MTTGSHISHITLLNDARYNDTQNNTRLNDTQNNDTEPYETWNNNILNKHWVT